MCTFLQAPYNSPEMKSKVQSPLEQLVCKTFLVCGFYLQKQRVNLIKMGRYNNSVLMQCFTSHLFYRSVLRPEEFAIFFFYASLFDIKQ